MKKKNIIILITIIIALLLGTYLVVKSKKNEEIPSVKNPIQKEEVIKEETEAIRFLRAIKGLKAENIEIIDEPVGLSGNFLAPRESILRGVDYFLKGTENDKMQDIKIDIGNDYVKLKTNYVLNSFITTPIEVKVLPLLDDNKDLVLKIDEVKFLDLKLAKWMVDLGVKNFVKDWFPKGGNMDVEFNEGYVVISKDNFKEVILEKLSIDSDGLKLDMIINLEEITSKSK